MEGYEYDIDDSEQFEVFDDTPTGFGTDESAPQDYYDFG